MRLLFVVGALLAVGVVPWAAAQGPQLSMDLEATPHGQPIAPGTVADVPFRFEVACPPGTVAEPAAATFEATVPAEVAWATVTANPPTFTSVMSAEACLAGQEEVFDGTVRVALTTDAPADAAVPITLTVAAAEHGAVHRAWNETARAFLMTRAALEKSLWARPPGSAFGMPLVVDNGGNGAIRVDLVIMRDTSEALDVRVPDSITIPARIAATLTLNVTTPGASVYENRQDQVHVRVDVVSLVDASLVENITLGVIVQTQGSEAFGVPAPTATLSFLVASLVVAARCRRRSAAA